MAKKKVDAVEEELEEELDGELDEEAGEDAIAPLDLNLGREDWNLVVAKVNEIIAKLNA